MLIGTEGETAVAHRGAERSTAGIDRVTVGSLSFRSHSSLPFRSHSLWTVDRSLLPRSRPPLTSVLPRSASPANVSDTRLAAGSYPRRRPARQSRSRHGGQSGRSRCVLRSRQALTRPGGSRYASIAERRSYSRTFASVNRRRCLWDRSSSIRSTISSVTRVGSLEPHRAVEQTVESRSPRLPTTFSRYSTSRRSFERYLPRRSRP